MTWFLRLHRHVRSAFRELPLECLTTAVAVVTLWSQVASHRDLVARLFTAAIAAVPLLFSVTILRWAGRIRGRAAGGLAVLAVLGAAGLTAPGLEFEEAFGWRLGLGLLAAVMCPFLAATAAAPRGARRVAFADFVRRFSEETTASGLLLGAALLAIAVLLLSLEHLFGLRRLFGLQLGQLGIDAGGAVAGPIALGYLHRLLASGASAQVPDLWRRLIARVAAPFLVAMFGLLLAYEVWVAARGQLPANMLSPLIVAAGAIGFASALLIESLVAVRQERALSPAEPHPWTASAMVRLSRRFGAALLVLLPLAMWALWIRIDQHGLTLMRASRMYALGCLGLLALWGTVRWIRRRPPLTWEVAAVTAAVAVAAAVGPLSVLNLSIRSQAARLEQAFDRAGVSTRIVAPEAPRSLTTVDGWAYLEMAERIQALADLQGERAVARVLSGDLDRCSHSWLADTCLAHLGVASPDAVREPAPRPAVLARPRFREPRLVAGFRAVDVALRFDDGEPQTLDGSTLRLRDNQLVSDLGGGRSARVDLTDYLGGWFDSDTLGEIPPIADEAGCARGHVLVQSALLDRTDAGPRLISLEGTWLVPIAPACARD